MSKKEKIIIWLMFLCYPLSMYGLKGVGYELGAASILAPMIAAILYMPIGGVFEWVFGKDKICPYTMMYISFVFVIFGLLFFNRETDYMIGRLIMLIGGTLLYIIKNNRL